MSHETKEPSIFDDDEPTYDKENPTILNCFELAEKLKCSPGTIRTLVHQARIPYFKLGRQGYRFDYHKVLAALEVDAKTPKTRTVYVEKRPKPKRSGAKFSFPLK